MGAYGKKYPFCAEEGSGLTLLEAERAFQLLPDPPKVENLNDYIVMAVNGNENGFAFFLHAYEERLNRRIRGFLLREGFRNTEPDRLFDYKLACVRAMLEVLPSYDPNGGASFLTFAHHDIENADKESGIGLLDIGRGGIGFAVTAEADFIRPRMMIVLGDNAHKSQKALALSEGNILRHAILII